ncbi:hypothetical protein EZS27_016234 [termite gut metagenome]|uniref:Uncharacterized protein n=1 Tax=termite gut metagenome TaxID=433724 RepID=A0A5J4RNE4_9ZZZZ
MISFCKYIYAKVMLVIQIYHKTGRKLQEKSRPEKFHNLALATKTLMTV